MPKTKFKINKSVRLLLVDDDPNMQRMVALFLNKKNYNLEIAGNGRKALDLLDKNKYELIISDMQMPLMDGLELLQNIQAKKIKTPVILISAYTSVNLPDETDVSNFAAVLFKPFDSSNLIATIEKVLKIKK
ncbi:MAG: response regulator [Calditrichaceae bacterium]|nr:response regulator [Calditrichaceae bacterium]